MRRLALSFLLLPVLAATAPAQQVVGRDQEVFTASEPIARGEWFRFIAFMGDVTVTQGSGNRVEVRAEKSGGRDVSDIGFKVIRDGDGVTICALLDDDDTCDDRGINVNRRGGWNWNRNNRPPRLDVTIQLPAGVKVQAQSGNGAVSVSGASDEVIARSGNGRVRVDGSGSDVVAASGNGAVSVQNARGAVNASSGNGDITVVTTQGPVSANSGNGDLIVTMGELRNDEDMEFNTGNGRIRVTMPASFTGTIDASTGNGSIVSDFPITLTGRISRTRLRGTIGQAGSGGRRIRMMSGNGQIELRRG
ncbi:MAG TPA: DUF4097 family beta strand repeat-containing protein [Gemmatimonadaceae bacterium]|nr:DUF4097 family beta strand repeat-containing protein [Gemmatimonadaceae bacterium]